MVSISQCLPHVLETQEEAAKSEAGFDVSPPGCIVGEAVRVHQLLTIQIWPREFPLFSDYLFGASAVYTQHDYVKPKHELLSSSNSETTIANSGQDFSSSASCSCTEAASSPASGTLLSLDDGLLQLCRSHKQQGSGAFPGPGAGRLAETWQKALHKAARAQMELSPPTSLQKQAAGLHM